jgi:hypothetical protein
VLSCGAAWLWCAVHGRTPFPVTAPGTGGDRPAGAANLVTCSQRLPEPKAGKNRLHLDFYPTGRNNALPMEQRIEIVEATVAELVDLDASVQRRTRQDDYRTRSIRRHARSGKQRILRRLRRTVGLHLRLGELQANTVGPKAGVSAQTELSAQNAATGLHRCGQIPYTYLAIGMRSPARGLLLGRLSRCAGPDVLGDRHHGLFRRLILDAAVAL